MCSLVSSGFISLIFSTCYGKMCLAQFATGAAMRFIECWMNARQPLDSYFDILGHFFAWGWMSCGHQGHRRKHAIYYSCAEWKQKYVQGDRVLKPFKLLAASSYTCPRHFFAVGPISTLQTIGAKFRCIFVTNTDLLILLRTPLSIDRCDANRWNCGAGTSSQREPTTPSKIYLEKLRKKVLNSIKLNINLNKMCRP